MRHFHAVIPFLLALLASASSPAQSVRPPNVLLILSDDQGTLDLNIYGSDDLYTPNLDALANAGLRFTNAYACPTCAASRASLLTGFHQGHSSVDGNDELDSGFRAVDVMTPQVLAPAEVEL